MRRLALCVVVVFAVACGASAPVPGIAQPAAKAVVWPLRGTAAPNGDVITRRPIVVKVPNDPAARPQSGLASADMIWELPVEGGITRYALLFHSQDASQVGPVRSARLSDLQYVPSLKAILAHVGGSEPVLAKIRPAAERGEFVDVDEFTKANAFERVSGKQAPYNAYTSTAKLREAAGDSARIDVPAFAFSDEAPKGGAPTRSFSVALSSRATYTWNGGSWKRAQDGQATKDAAGGQDVSPVNVVIVKTDVTEIPGTADVTGAASVDFRSTGSGTAIVFRDGMRIDGTWSRQQGEMYRFADAGGAEVRLKPGLTWLHVIPKDMAVDAG